MSALVIALVIVALILALIEQIMAHGRSLICWAVICLALALLIPVLSTLAH